MTAPTYANDPNGILGTDILFEISDSGVATLTLNRDHTGHVGEQIGEEADIDPLLCQMEGSVTKFVEGKVLKARCIAHGHEPIRAIAPPGPSRSRSTGSRHVRSSHSAAATRARDPSVVVSAAATETLPASVILEGRVPIAIPA